MDKLEYNKYILTLIIKKALDKDKLSQELEKQIYTHIKFKLKNKDTS
ncbi:hypothetical protein [Clostridium tertium]|nr:hypothetical protein [Clostridium tertium]